MLLRGDKNTCHLFGLVNVSFAWGNYTDFALILAFLRGFLHWKETHNLQQMKKWPRVTYKGAKGSSNQGFSSRYLLITSLILFAYEALKPSK